MIAKILRLNQRIQAHELKLVDWSVMLAFINLAAFILSISIIDAIFLSYYDIDWLPLFLTGSSLSLAAASLSYSQAIKHIHPDKIHRMIQVVSIFMFCGLRFVLMLEGPWVFGVCIALHTLIYLQNIMVWNILGELFDSRQTRRIFPVLTAGSSCGAILGGCLLPILIPLLGVKNLLFVIALIAMGVGLISQKLNALQPAELKAPITRTRFIRLNTLLTEPLTRNLLVIAVFSFMAMTLVDYQFKAELQQAFNQDEIGSFLGKFYMMSDGLALAMQLFAVSPVINSMGLRVVLLVLPVVLGLFSSSALLAHSFMAVVAVKLVDNSFRFTFHKVGTEMSLAPVSPHLRQQIKTLITGFVQPMSTLIICLLLIVMGDTVQTTPQYVLLMILILAVIWFYFGLFSKKHYLSALEQALTQHRVLGEEVYSSQLLDDDGVSLVAFKLKQTSEPLKYEFLLKILLQASAYQIKKFLMPELMQHKPELRKIAWQLVLAHPDLVLPGAPLISHLKAEKEEDIQALILIYFSRQPESLLSEELLLACWESDRLKIPVALYLMQHQIQLPQTGNLNQMVRAHALSATPTFREEACFAMGELKQPQYIPLLIQLSQDTHPQVQEAGLRAIQRVGLSAFFPHIFKMAQSPKAPVLVSELLSQYGGTFTQALSESPRYTKPILKSLGLLFQREEAVNLLFQAAHSAPFEQREEALKILGRIHQKTGSPFAFERILPLILTELRHVLAYRDYATREQPLEFLTTELHFRESQAIVRIFLALVLSYPPALIKKALWGYQSKNPRQRAHAIDLLESQIPHDDLKKALLPLLEKNPLASIQGIKAYLAAHSGPLKKNVNLHKDPWLRLCIAHDIIQKNPKQREGWIMQEQTLFKYIEIVLRLKDVNLFSSLSGEELFSLAKVAQKVDFDEGQTIFNEGDLGESLFVLTSGRVKVVAKDETINTLSQGAVFGEIALLDGNPRTASIVALSDVELLYISRDDFQALMDEKPKICLGITQQLATYTRQLMSQIEALKQ